MTKAVAKIKQTREVLYSPQMTDQFKAALPAHITTEKFLRVVMTALNNSPALLDTDRSSLFGACVLAAQDGLLPDGREAALVKYGNKAAYLPMVAGIMKKVRNSGELKSLSSNVVYENDEFTYFVDENGEHFRHAPLFKGDRGKPMGVYAQALTKDGGIYFEFLGESDVKKIQNVAKSKNIWKEWEGEMWKKTAIRRLSKKLPMSTDVEQVIQRDDELYDLGNQDKEPKEIQGTAETASDRPNALLSAVVPNADPVPETLENVQPVQQEETQAPI